MNTQNDIFSSLYSSLPQNTLNILNKSVKKTYIDLHDEAPTDSSIFLNFEPIQVKQTVDHTMEELNALKTTQNWEGVNRMIRTFGDDFYKKNPDISVEFDDYQVIVDALIRYYTE
jgi:hypothetical protein